MNEAVIWAILWFLSIGVGEVVIWFTLFIGFAALGEAIEQEWLAVVGLIVGWIGAAGWFVFAGYHLIIQIITIIQLIF